MDDFYMHHCKLIISVIYITDLFLVLLFDVWGGFFLQGSEATEKYKIYLKLDAILIVYLDVIHTLCFSDLCPPGHWLWKMVTYKHFNAKLWINNLNSLCCPIHHNTEGLRWSKLASVYWEISCLTRNTSGWVYRPNNDCGGRFLLWCIRSLTENC